MTHEEAKRDHWKDNTVARANGWSNDDSWRAYFFFANDEERYSHMKAVAPKPFMDEQDDVDRYEADMEEFLIYLEDTALESGWYPPGGELADVNWEEVGDALIGKIEEQLPWSPEPL